MTLTPADHRAIAQELAAIVLPILCGQLPGQVVASDSAEGEVARVKRQALALAQQGKKQESIDLLKTLSKRRASHA